MVPGSAPIRSFRPPPDNMLHIVNDEVGEIPCERQCGRGCREGVGAAIVILGRKAPVIAANLGPHCILVGIEDDGGSTQFEERAWRVEEAAVYIQSIAPPSRSLRSPVRWPHRLIT